MDRKFIGLSGALFLLFTIFAVYVLAGSPFKRFIRASEDVTPSTTGSILITWPLVVETNGHSTVTAFVRSKSGKPISNKNVTFSTTLGEITEATTTSDANGKAETSLVCTQPGIAQISALIDNTIPISQQISVECK